MSEFLGGVSLLILIGLTVFFLIVALFSFIIAYRLMRVDNSFYDELKARYASPLDGLKGSVKNSGRDDVYTTSGMTTRKFGKFNFIIQCHKLSDEAVSKLISPR